MKNLLKKTTYIGITMMLIGCGGGNSTDGEPSQGTSGEKTTTVPNVETVTNQAPVANAGDDRSIGVNLMITIVGEGTDSDGSIVSYQWKKGTEVLSNTQTLEYTPTVIGTDTLTLTVTDNGGLSGSDTVDVVSFALKQEAKF